MPCCPALSSSTSFSGGGEKAFLLWQIWEQIALSWKENYPITSRRTLWYGRTRDRGIGRIWYRFVVESYLPPIFGTIVGSEMKKVDSGTMLSSVTAPDSRSYLTRRWYRTLSQGAS